MDAFRDFCENTKLHGWRHVVNREHSVFERSLWFMLNIGAIVVSIIMIHATTKLFENPITTTLKWDPLHVDSIPFPALTICPTFQLKPQRPSGDPETVEERLVQEMCLLDPNAAIKWDPFDEHLYFDRLREVSIKPTDLFAGCEILGVKYKCSDFYQEVLTSFGLCYSFNQFPLGAILAETAEYPRHLIGNPWIKLVFDTWLRNGTYFTNGTSSYPITILNSTKRDAFKIKLTLNCAGELQTCRKAPIGLLAQIHHPAELSRLSEAPYFLAFGGVHNVRVRPQFVRSPLTRANFAVEHNSCLFADENPLSLFKTYNARNCRIECLADKTIRLCNCTSMHLPRTKDSNVCSQGLSECYRKVSVDLIEKELDKKSQCLYQCESLSYMTKMRIFPFHSDEYPGADIKCNDPRPAILNIMYESDRHQVMEQQVIFGWTNLLAYTGGFLGLIMGFSMMTICEIVYFLIFRPVSNYLLAKRSGNEARNSQIVKVKPAMKGKLVNKFPEWRNDGAPRPKTNFLF